MLADRRRQLRAVVAVYWPRLRETAFNAWATHLPSRRLRIRLLRLMGARIGEGSVVFRGTTVLYPERLVIGSFSTIGWDCVLHAHGGITIGDDVEIASYAHLYAGDHDMSTSDYSIRSDPITIERHACVAARATVLRGVTVHEGGVVAAGSVATRDVQAREIVAGVPAKPVGRRPETLDYHLGWSLPLY